MFFGVFSLIIFKSISKANNTFIRSLAGRNFLKG